MHISAKGTSVLYMRAAVPFNSLRSNAAEHRVLFSALQGKLWLWILERKLDGKMFHCCLWSSQFGFQPSVHTSRQIQLSEDIIIYCFLSTAVFCFLAPTWFIFAFCSCECVRYLAWIGRESHECLCHCAVGRRQIRSFVWSQQQVFGSVMSLHLIDVERETKNSFDNGNISHLPQCNHRQCCKNDCCDYISFLH